MEHKFYASQELFQQMVLKYVSHTQVVQSGDEVHQLARPVNTEDQEMR